MSFSPGAHFFAEVEDRQVSIPGPRMRAPTCRAKCEYSVIFTSTLYSILLLRILQWYVSSNAGQL